MPRWVAGGRRSLMRNKLLAKFNTGSLRQVIVLQTPPTGTGTRGERTGDWSNLATVHAKVETLSGDELIQAHQLVANATHRITIRYQSGLTPEHRAKFGSRYLYIRAVNNIEELNRIMVLTCEEEL